MTQLLIRLFVRDPENTRDPQVRGRYGRLAGLVGLVCNLLLCSGKFLAGFLFGSVSIMNYSAASDENIVKGVAILGELTRQFCG